jgi:hypothetical protein
MQPDDLLSALQWPAMAITLLSAWLVASQSERKRQYGFWFFIVSNVLWIIWGWHDGAIALIVLQVGLFALNLRGAVKNSDT